MAANDSCTSRTVHLCFKNPSSAQSLQVRVSVQVKPTGSEHSSGVSEGEAGSASDVHL